jgi:16S rRNA (adenine1518-N6/adenine1519-N6)-dimethyltransferase
VAAADLGPDDEVWEVGPGLGTLTRELARRAGRVVAVELDAACCRCWPRRSRRGPTCGGRARRRPAGRPRAAAPDAAFVANLPYHVGTAVLGRVLAARGASGAPSCWCSGRSASASSPPGRRPPSAASASGWPTTGGRASVRWVPPGAFLPPPKVTSAVVRIDLDPGVRPDPRTFAFVRDGFRHRRKTLLANLRAAGDDPERRPRRSPSLGGRPRRAGRDARPRHLPAAGATCCGAPDPRPRADDDAPGRGRGRILPGRHAARPVGRHPGTHPGRRLLHGRYPRGG